jgi:hypothetical protein
MAGIKSAAAGVQSRRVLDGENFSPFLCPARLVVAHLELNERELAVACPHGQVPVLLSNTKDASRHGFLRKKRRSVLAERSQKNQCHQWSVLKSDIGSIPKHLPATGAPNIRPGASKLASSGRRSLQTNRCLSCPTKKSGKPQIFWRNEPKENECYQ